MKKHLAIITLAILLGLINKWAYAPYYLWFFSVISFSGFFALIRTTQTFKFAACVSLAYFVPYFLNFGAIAHNSYETKVIYSVCACYGIFAALWIGMGAWITRHLPIFFHLLVYSLLFGSMEWIRGNFLSGLPWQTISYITLTHEIFAQTASIWGIYGLTIPLVFILTAPSAIILEPKKAEGWICILFATVLLFSGFFYGKERLEKHLIHYWPEVTLRLVQTNFLAGDRKMEDMDQVLQQHLDYSLKEDSSSITAFVWSETAILHHYISDIDPENKKYNRFISEIAALIPKKSYLLAGLFRASIEEIHPLAAKEPVDIKLIDRSHGLAVINEEGLIDWYTKHHLLPFGEFDPFQQENAASFENLFEEGKKYTPGNGPTVINLKGLPAFAPVVCYESIFPCDIIAKEMQRPEWILVIANDYHYAGTHFPYWMREMSRMRAIEQGLPLVRVANAGTSSVFDGAGRLIVDLPEGTVKTVDVQLPKPLEEATFYAVYGDLLFWVISGVLFVICLGKIVKKQVD